MRNIAAVLLLLTVSAVFTAAQSGNVRPNREAELPVQNNAQNPASNPQKSADDDVLKVETALVTIPVSVLDARGRFVANLAKQDFKVFEDGKEQEIEYFAAAEQPITVALVLDTSPSYEQRVGQVQNAAIAFVNQLKPNDTVTVIEFDANINVLCEPTVDRRKIEKAIRKADIGGGTSLYDAVDDAVTKRLSRIEGRKAVVLFTDGVDTESRIADFETSIAAAEKSQSPVFIIYFNTLEENLKSGADPTQFGTRPEDYEQGRKYLLELADKTGGLAIYADIDKLDPAFAAIAAELKQLYSLGYYPADPGKTGQRRQIRVQVDKPAVTVRARESYLVGGESKPAAAAGDKKKKKN